MHNTDHPLQKPPAGRATGSPVRSRGRPAAETWPQGKRSGQARTASGDPAQRSVFFELIERTVTRDRVYKDGLYLNEPPGRSFRVLDARGERHTLSLQHSPVTLRRVLR